MSEEIRAFVTSISGIFNISGNKINLKIKTKKPGTYSKQVSTDTTYNLSKSNVKVANIVRDELTAL